MTTDEIGIIYGTTKTPIPWYKNTKIIAGIVGIGVLSFVIYRVYRVYFYKSETNNHTFKWLQNDISLNPDKVLTHRN